MNYCGNVPMGLEDDPKAPYNEGGKAEKDFTIMVSQSLSKAVDISTSDYRADNFSISNGNWNPKYVLRDTEENVYREKHYTPKELLEIFKSYLKLEVSRYKQAIDVDRCEFLIKECSNWVEDDTAFIQE